MTSKHLYSILETMGKPLFILIAAFLFFFTYSCDNEQKKEVPVKIPATISNQNNTGLVTKGSLLFGSNDDATVFLEASLIHMQADSANATADSLRLTYQNDANNIDVNFELGTHFAVLGSFFSIEDANNSIDSALLLLTNVITINPKYRNGAAYFNRAQNHAIAQEWDKAIRDIDSYIEIDPEPSAYSQLILAKANYALGDSIAACEHIKIMQEALGNSYSSATSIWIERCK